MKKFKTPDLNAPRYRAKTTTLLNKKVYEAFKEKYSKYADMSLEEFKKIINTFNKNIADEVINNRDGVELPEKLGYLFVGKCEKKASNDNIDYGNSIKYKKQVSHRNWESDGYLAKIFYTNYAFKYRIKDRELWEFKANKDFRKKTSESFSELYSKYVLVTDKQKISDLYNKYTSTEFFKKKTEKELDDYDEFKLD